MNTLYRLKFLPGSSDDRSRTIPILRSEFHRGTFNRSRKSTRNERCGDA